MDLVKAAEVSKYDLSKILPICCHQTMLIQEPNCFEDLAPNFKEVQLIVVRILFIH
jgi:hypothetical protein